MITIFNRKELLVTLDIKKQADIRRRLTKEGIDYKIKTVNLLSTSTPGNSRATIGTFNQNMASSYEYIIYVHKKDYDLAAAVINR